MPLERDKLKMDHIKIFLNHIMGSCNMAKVVRSEMLSGFLETESELNDTDDGGVRFCDYTGISSRFFIEPIMLSISEIESITIALTDLYVKYGLNPVFHPSVTPINKYLQMRDFCNERVYPNPTTTVDIEFCDYARGRCPYSKSCTHTIEGKHDCPCYARTVKSVIFNYEKYK